MLEIKYNNDLNFETIQLQNLKFVSIQCAVEQENYSKMINLVKIDVLNL